jgi:hypothetical protein
MNKAVEPIINGIAKALKLRWHKRHGSHMQHRKHKANRAKAEK